MFFHGWNPSGNYHPWKTVAPDLVKAWTLGSIAKLFNDDSVAMQITFKKTPILKGYWRGIILSSFNGASWNSSAYHYESFYPFHELTANENADYEILLEPHQKKWLFYEGYPGASTPHLLFSPRLGLIRPNEELVTQRFAYSIKTQSAPFHVLNPADYAEAMQLPRNIDPRLTVWAKTQFANSHQEVKVFINFLQDYIHQQSFWYTLNPPITASNTNQLDNFWFNTQKGFCEHYASAVTFILRAAGIPARVIIGYHGGEWNPISHTITIHQSDAHAWLEYWQEGMGWKPMDPTAFIALERIDKTIESREIDLNQGDKIVISELAWGRKLRFYLDTAQFFTEKWFLYYNQNAQQNLLHNVGLGNWKEQELLQVSVGCVILFFILVGLGYQWWQRRTLDALLLEYHLLQKEFRKFTVSTPPSATLKQQCQSLANNAPALASDLSSFLYRYEQLRLKQSKMDSNKNKKETIRLFKTLRYKLRRS